MFEIKAKEAENNNDITPARVQKLNTLVMGAIKAYSDFLKCFHPKPDQSADDPVDADSIDWFLMGHLSLARMYGKVLGGDAKGMRDSLVRSLDEYSWLLKYHDKHPELCAGRFEAEFSVCQEMCKLLPLKINELSATM
eukprot:TRINITY_DN26441_c0_g1_i4.p1 TRINITY_DN26441_c0_g1~~TRINITY_DN26441_c0_g1_i4.p1  ORF type:complete len:138 (-),score=38.69 TRINITY_DN26441_c0_g1_i4:92-505(-)